MSTKNPLGARERVSYGIGDMGINFFFMTTLTYLPYFYTDILGISAIALAGVMFTARMVDAVTDPVMGLIAERTNTRWGRLRPYIFLGAIPLGVIGVLVFTVPDTGTDKLLWAYATYIAFGIAYTVVSIPYSTMTASLTADHHERTVLSTLRMGFAFAGGFIVSVFMPTWVGWADTPEEGYRNVMIAFAVVGTLMLWATAFWTEERLQPKVDKIPIAKSLICVVKNPPLLVVMLLFTCSMFAFTLRQSVAVYYFKYNLERPDLIGMFFGATLGTMLVGLLAVPKLAERYGKAGCIIVGALVTIVGFTGMYFIGYTSPAWTTFWGCLIALGATPVAVLGWAMIPDTVEYAQVRHGVRADGAIYSFSSFFQKLAKTLGGTAVALGLGFAGYVANEAQSPESLEAIRLMMTLGPGLIMVITILVASFYKLDRTAHERLVQELELGATRT